MKTFTILLILFAFGCKNRDPIDFNLKSTHQEAVLKAKFPDPYKLTLSCKKAKASEVTVFLETSSGVRSYVNMVTKDTTVAFDWYDPLCKVSLQTTDRDQSVKGTVQFH